MKYIRYIFLCLFVALVVFATKVFSASDGHDTPQDILTARVDTFGYYPIPEFLYVDSANYAGSELHGQRTLWTLDNGHRRLAAIVNYKHGVISDSLVVYNYGKEFVCMRIDSIKPSEVEGELTGLYTEFEPSGFPRISGHVMFMNHPYSPFDIFGFWIIGTGRFTGYNSRGEVEYTVDHGEDYGSLQTSYFTDSLALMICGSSAIEEKPANILVDGYREGIWADVIRRDLRGQHIQAMQIFLSAPIKMVC